MLAETHKCTDTSFKGGRFEAMGRVNLENSISISPFDLLRQRLNMPDPWILTEATAVSKRQITPRIINRIFRRMWVGVRLGSVAAAFSRLCSVNGTR